MLSTTQLQKTWFLSDTVLYPEAVAFLHKMIKQKGCNPLSTSQVSGLLNVAQAASYKELDKYVKHQMGRNWSYSKQDIKDFYTELDAYLIELRTKRIRREFALLDASLSGSAMLQAVDELTGILAQEFIGHLLAENMVLLQEHEEKKRLQRR